MSKSLCSSDRDQAHLKTKRIIIVGVLVILGIVYVVSTIIPNVRRRSEWNQTIRALRGLPTQRVRSAVEGFVRAQTKGAGVSDTVSLRELVSGGFLSPDEAAPFNGMDVTFAAGVDEGRPQQIVAQVRLRSGGVAVELGDGSIQQVTKAGLEKLQR
jgi:hypothetical protein